MGRILKKKDPVKKKAQLATRDDDGAVQSGGADAPADSTRCRRSSGSLSAQIKSKAVVKDPNIVHKSMPVSARGQD